MNYQRASCRLCGSKNEILHACWKCRRKYNETCMVCLIPLYLCDSVRTGKCNSCREKHIDEQMFKKELYNSDTIIREMSARPGGSAYLRALASFNLNKNLLQR